ncbi:hypothetical protein GYMLUDRAFT_250252 [Collybiopsis luxurians FD-317 M1]|uniref:Uncharacterized protein n=1 Tax=Collybiopsis luxurians FD-317 M1 TaxID=944289 RepID=A0A0D0BVG7_9AGAR|nr:hypothetical protein GYMLUDRAFT_250252 [Collybiopsis luxurians FD-317 M1]
MDWGNHGIQLPAPSPLPEISMQSEGLTVCPDLIYALSPSPELKTASLLINSTAEVEAERTEVRTRMWMWVKANARVRAGEEEEEEVLEADSELDVDPSLAVFYDQL